MNTVKGLSHLVRMEAKQRLAREPYQNINSAIQSVLMDLWQEIAPVMLENKRKEKEKKDGKGNVSETQEKNPQ